MRKTLRFIAALVTLDSRLIRDSMETSESTATSPPSP